MGCIHIILQLSQVCQRVNNNVMTQQQQHLEIFPLFALNSPKDGGFNFKTKDIGLVMTISGVGILPLQLFVYPRLAKKLHALGTARLGFACLPLILLALSYNLTKPVENLGDMIDMLTCSFCKLCNISSNFNPL